MATVYKIHPGVGIARVAPAVEYFLAGETPDAPPLDIDAAGSDAGFTGYKNAASVMRRQGVRFRVFEYERKSDGTETLLREITSAEASIAWTVKLAATKAAGFIQNQEQDDGATYIVPDQTPRNSGIASVQLQTDVTLQAQGNNTKPAPGTEPKGMIQEKLLYLGEAHTDAKGRLLVLPGFGGAFTWLPAGDPRLQLSDFYDNPGWYDDIADGSVEATVTFPGAMPQSAVRAWVLTAPPDFAPDTAPVTTIYDIALQSVNAPLPSTVTYPQDIEPILRRAAGLLQTSARPVWKSVSTLLADPRAADNSTTDAAVAALRQNLTKLLLEDTRTDMRDYRLTKRQQDILGRYRAGQFQSLADTSRPVQSAGQLSDRAALDRCVGGGFFPGIEAGGTLRQPGIFEDQGRLTLTTFTDHDGTVKALAPGLLSGRMACPWHADFVECSGAWWPAQRPDIVGRNATGGSKGNWHRKVAVGDGHNPQSRRAMIDNFARLGVVVKAADGTYGEVGRDTALDTGV